MPEIPDVEVYVERLRAFLAGKVLRKISVASPFVLRSVDPSPQQLVGKKFIDFDRIGKRLVFAFEDELFVVIHLMIAGRLRWRKPDAKVPKGRGLVGFYVEEGCLLFTEEGKKKRASMHVVKGREKLTEFSRGGLDVRAASAKAFSAQIKEKNRTVKRALCDPTILDGIGNAYSDEILHRARMSPFKQTQKLTEREVEELRGAIIEVLDEWTARLRNEVGEKFPEKVTAFHEDMAVHGKYKQPCLVCGTEVQRVVYADNEMNYCPRCQTGGKLLADRSLSRLLKESWPKHID